MLRSRLGWEEEVAVLIETLATKTTISNSLRSSFLIFPNYYQGTFGVKIVCYKHLRSNNGDWNHCFH